MCETSATTKHEVVAQLVNKIRPLIQVMKTIIEAVIEKHSKDPNTRVATSQEKQANPDRKSTGALTSEVTYVTGSLQTPPKRKTKAPPMGRDMVQDRKKIDPVQERELAQGRMDLSPWKWRLPFAKLGKYRWTPKWKMKNQEAHSKCPQEQNHLFESNTAMLRDQQNPYKEPIVKKVRKTIQTA